MAPSTSPRTRIGRRRPILGAVVLALALVVAACGGGDNGSSDSASGGSGDSGGSDTNAADCPVKALDSATAPVDITLWHAYVGLTKTTLEGLAAKFNASQNKVKVTVEAQGTYEELLKKFEDALGDPATLPDIVLTEDTTTQFMINTDQVVPAASCIAADPSAKATYDDILPAVTAAYTVDGTLWPAAYSVSTPILYANNNLLKAGGVDTTTYPATLAELRTAAEKMKAANIPGLEAPLVMKIDSWYIEHWLTGVKKPVVNNDNGRSELATTSRLDQPTTKELFDWLKGMVDDGLLKAIPSTASGIDEYLAINNKTAAMLIQTSTAITTVNALLEGSVKPGQLSDVGANTDISQGLDIGVGLVPGIKAAGQGQIGGSGWYLVKQKDQAAVAAGWSFMKFFLQTPNQVEWTLKASYLPVLKSAADDPTLQADFTGTTKGKWLSTAYQGLSNLNPRFPGPVIGPYKEFRTDVRAALDDVMLAGKPTAEAISTANTKFQQALDTYKKDVGG